MVDLDAGWVTVQHPKIVWSPVNHDIVIAGNLRDRILDWFEPVALPDKFGIESMRFVAGRRVGVRI